MISLQGLRQRRLELKDLPLRESINLLKNVGEYYEQVIPSKMSFAFIEETEKLLNDLYLRCLREANSTRLSANILQALSQAGSLSIAVKQKKFDPEFVKVGKQLGRTLIAISKTIN